MNESQGFKLQYLPAFLLLGLIGLLLITGFVILSGVSEKGYPIAGITSPTPVGAALLTEIFTPTLTSTASQTPKPTWTLQPTMTSTPSPTPTRSATPTRVRIPTLTPARPYPYNEVYEFSTLTPEHMDKIAGTVAEYPDAKFYRPEDRTDPAYHAYFIYPSLAYQEALLRFPTALQTESWQWGLAFSLAHLGDPQAVNLYGQFINQALNLEGYSPQRLPEWFSTKTADLTLQVHPLNLASDQTETFLLEIQPGNVLYLLVSGQAADSSVIPLSDRFELANEPGTSYTTLDLDGDGMYELAYYQPTSPGGESISNLHIYDLNEIQPQPIELTPSIPVNYKITAKVELSAEKESENSSEILVLKAVFYPACPFSVTMKYKWDAVLSTIIPSGPPVFLLEPDQENLAYCDPLLTHAEAFWPLEARLEVERALLPFWPPAADPEGRPYSALANDKLRFTNALNLALIGYPDQLQESKEILQNLQDNPTDPESVWTTVAREFLYLLEDGQGLYKACQSTPDCDLRQALMQIVSSSLTSNPASILPQLGVSIRSSGSFDFDQDGTADRWLTIRPRLNEQLEFWILTKSNNTVQALYVDEVDTNDPQPFWANADVYPGVFQIKANKGYRMLRWTQNDTAYIEPVLVDPVITTYTRDAVYLAEETLMSGGSPEQVRDDLLAVLHSGRFNCINHRICDRFWYALGLAYELSGDLFQARDTYIKLWWENSTSPLTAMARMKLEIITPTSTPSRTSTSTPTATLTAVVTPTVTP